MRKCVYLLPGIRKIPSASSPNSNNVHAHSSIGKAISRPVAFKCSVNGNPNVGFIELSSEKVKKNVMLYIFMLYHKTKK